jgi:hypothetical protein
MTYPTLRKAFEMMLNDQGMGIHDIPLEQVDFAGEGITTDSLQVAEVYLATLPETELEELCVGDQDNWPPIYEKIGKWGSEVIHRTLECMFENIMLGEDHG